MSVGQIESAFDACGDHQVELIHYGFSDPKSLGRLPTRRGVSTNIFVDKSTGKLYQRHFRNTASRVLLREANFVRLKFSFVNWD